MNVIETRGLTRYFAAKRAVRGLDLDVPQGCILGLLGENGSGKTTTINLLMGALVPNEGTARVFGVDPLQMPPATRARIGYLADEAALPGWMKLREATRLHASYFEQWDTQARRRLMKEYDLDADQPYGALSKGQKRRFMLTLIVSQRPDLLILDEPAGGLDVAVRRQFLDLLIALANEREITILLSSHILSDVERVVDHVAFIKAGGLVLQAPLEDLRARVKRLCLPASTDEATLSKRFNLLSTRRAGDALLAVVDDFEPARLNGLDARVEHLNLEELFLVFNTLGPTKEEA